MIGTNLSEHLERHGPLALGQGMFLPEGKPGLSEWFDRMGFTYSRPPALGGWERATKLVAARRLADWWGHSGAYRYEPEWVMWGPELGQLPGETLAEWFREEGWFRY